MNMTDICRECEGNETTQCMQELLDKVARLSKRNDELEKENLALKIDAERLIHKNWKTEGQRDDLERLRYWRNAEKDLPRCNKNTGRSNKIQILTKEGVIHTGFYSACASNWAICPTDSIGLVGAYAPRGEIIAWRPLDLSEGQHDSQ